MAVPDYQSLMLPLLKRVAASPQPVSIVDLVQPLGKDLGLSDEDIAERLPSGRFGRFYNRMHWAKLYMQRAGLIDAPQRGRFQVTARGRGVLAENPSRIDNTTLSRFPEFSAWRAASTATEPGTSEHDAQNATPNETPEERIFSALRELEAGLRSELLDHVRRMSAGDFEGLIVRLLTAMGYGKGQKELAKALGGTGDGGMDGVIDQDPLGLDQVYVQAKRWKEGNSVGSKEIRDFIGALNIHRANKGVFVTASSFSAEAEKAARGATVHVVLIDGNGLAELMIQHEVGALARDVIKIKELDEGFFET